MSKFYAGLTVLEILGVAVKKEIDAANFYKNLAGQIANPIIKDRFLQLAKEERKHRAMLQAEYKRLTGGEKVSVPKEMVPKIREAFDFTKGNIEEALQFAISAERDAQKLYAEAAKKSKDPRGKRMLDYLVEFEKSHENLLKSELAFYRKSPTWFDEPDDLIHVGP